VDDHFDPSRGHGHCIAKGADLNRMMAELYWPSNRLLQGQRRLDDIADFGIGMLGANGIVAGGIAIVTGAGLAARGWKARAPSRCPSLAMAPRYAGPFHECLNIAATWKLPMLYVCENNIVPPRKPPPPRRTRERRSGPSRRLRHSGVVVDGNDAFAVYQAAHAAVERARSGDGPTRLECKTYRWRGPHRTCRSGRSRDRAEVDAWQRKDRSHCSSASFGIRANSMIRGSSCQAAKTSSGRLLG